MMRRVSSLLAVSALLLACDEQPTNIPNSDEIQPVDAFTVPVEPQRVKWRVKLNADYSLHTPGVGPDGTVYVNVENGKVYAIAPNGTQRWVFQAGIGGGVDGPVSVGPDGTIYAAGTVPDPNGNGATGAIFAITPQGTQKWVFNQTNHLIIAGPNVGPDGNIYAVAEYTGIGLFSLTPQGQLRFKTGAFMEHGPLGESIVFGSNQLYFAFDGGPIGPYQALFGYTFAGVQRFAAMPTANGAQPVVGPNGNIVVQTFPYNTGLGLSAYSPAGALVWRVSEGSNTMDNPDVGPDNIAYAVRNLSTLFAVSPSGTELWSYRDPGIMFQPRVRAQNDFLFMGGRITYGQPGFFLAVGTNGVPLWRVDLPDEPGFSPYGQLVPVTRPVFSPDQSTAYMVTDVAGDGANPYCFLYAIDLATSSGGTVPPTTNTTPKVTIVATTATTIKPGGSVTVKGTFTDADNGPWALSFRWGNGRTSANATVPGSYTRTRTYSTVGTYTVRLHVTDARGATGISNAITVKVQ
jgi:hypothetical protein